MKKSLLIILFTVVIMFLGACAGKDADITLMVGGAPNEIEYWERLINGFERNSNIAVRIIRQPTDSDQRRQGLLIPLKSGLSDPDVFLMDVVWLGQFASSGWLESLEPYLEKSNFSIKPFFENVVDFADRYKNTLFALPVYVDGGLLYYRKDILAKYGYDAPPATWEELLEYSLKIQNNERLKNTEFYGFVWQGAQYEGLVCTFLEFAASHRGKEKGQSPFPEIEALKFMYELIHRHKVSPPNTYTEMKEEEVRSYFQRGSALFERNWPYAWKLHEENDSPVKGKIGISSLPHFNGGKSASALGGWHIGISRHSDAKNKAWELVKFITSYETQKQLTLNLGWNPARKDVYESKEIMEKLPHLYVLKDTFENVVARPNVPYYSQLSEAIQINVNASLSGKLQPAEAIDKMQKEIEVISVLYGEK